MSTTATLYFTKFENGEKQILTQIWWEHANEPEVLKVRPIAAFQLRDFTLAEFQKIMDIPFKAAIDTYFPNI